MPSGSPSTQFGEPGGPDPVEAGRKGGETPKGVSPMLLLFRHMDEDKAKKYALAFERKILDGEFQHFKFLIDSHDGPIKQETDMRITGDRTVVLGEGGGEKVPPEEDEE